MVKATPTVRAATEGIDHALHDLIKWTRRTLGETPPAVYEAMAEFDRWGRVNGMLVEHRRTAAELGRRDRVAVDGHIKAVDGPFAEAKELVGGYAVIDVRSRDEAVELGRRLMQIHLDHWPGWEGSCEIRQIAEY